jgi:hypothetical protein
MRCSTRKTEERVGAPPAGYEPASLRIEICESATNQYRTDWFNTA